MPRYRSTLPHYVPPILLALLLMLFFGFGPTPARAQSFGILMMPGAPPVPDWQKGAYDDGPMPPADKLTAAIMDVLHPECGAANPLQHLYVCILTSRGRDVFIQMQAATNVRRMDGHTTSPHHVAIGHDHVVCGERRMMLTPLVRGFDQVCSINGVPEQIEFRLTTVPEDYPEQGFPHGSFKVARLEPGDFLLPVGS